MILQLYRFDHAKIEGRRMWGRVLIFSITGPMALWFVDLYPPIFLAGSLLLNAVVTMTVSGIGCALALSSREAKTRRTTLGRWDLRVALVCLAIYVTFYVLLVLYVQQTRDAGLFGSRMIKGLELLPTVPAGKTDIELLRLYGLDVSAIWTSRSLFFSNAALLLSYNAMFFFLGRGLTYLEFSVSGAWATSTKPPRAKPAGGANGDGPVKKEAIGE